VVPKPEPGSRPAVTSEPQRPAQEMSLQSLRPGVDYLYCDDCGHHVACIRLQPGVWEVQCSRCVGECGLCACRRTGSCLGKGKTPVQTHMYVVGT
jgi:hypothetical protein